MIPDDAVEEIIEIWDNSTKKSAFYYANGEKVGYRYWHETGQLLMQYDIKDGKMHGSFQTWHDNSILFEDAHYIDGLEHGITRQYDDNGNLIGAYEMNRGTGVDLWYSARGILAEERYYKNGQRDGYERWWNDDNETVFIEQHFKKGTQHGIYREWNQYGRLRRGFPQYFINDQKVTKRQYLKACEQDDSLPKFNVEENNPQRVLPKRLMQLMIERSL